ncbi:MAG: alpha/beta hydrolase [Rhodobacter sp.]|nr:alpha/beta hydrolase [Rhodobacter sp.]
MADPPDSYAARDYLRPYLPFLPDVMRLPRDPEEEWWTWRDTQVHLDRLDADDAPLKVILLHGGGGNGRVIGAFGALVHSLGYSYVAPDLPGFGLTVPGPDYDPDYRSWVALVADLIDREQSRDGLPVVTFGGSLGGMLAYNVAAASGKVRGVIATTLADPRNIEALDALARSKLWSRIGNLFMNVVPRLTDRLTIPARMISRMDAMTNDPAFSRVFVGDPLVGGARVKIGFYRSMASYDPPIAPEAFDLCPLLLAHPAEDTWTPLSVSKPFFDRLGCDKELITLEGCGHLPYEEPGVSQLREAVRRFLSRISSQVQRSDPSPVAGS